MSFTKGRQRPLPSEIFFAGEKENANLNLNEFQYYNLQYIDQSRGSLLSISALLGGGEGGSLHVDRLEAHTNIQKMATEKLLVDLVDFKSI